MSKKRIPTNWMLFFLHPFPKHDWNNQQIANQGGNQGRTNQHPNRNRRGIARHQQTQKPKK